MNPPSHELHSVNCAVCNSPVRISVEVILGQQATCSPSCHEALVSDLERQFGAIKLVTRLRDGRTFIVPLRHIIAHGIREQELERFPEAP